MKKHQAAQQKLLFTLLLVSAMATFSACGTTPAADSDRVESGMSTDSANQNTKVSISVDGDGDQSGELMDISGASADKLNQSTVSTETTTVDTAQLIAEKKALLAKDRALVDEIASTGDMARCKEISDINLQQSCEANIIIDLATAAKDPTVCERASFENIVADCKELVGMAIGI